MGCNKLAVMSWDPAREANLCGCFCQVFFAGLGNSRKVERQLNMKLLSPAGLATTQRRAARERMESGNENAEGEIRETASRD
jgi:hypothetical protein